MTSKPLPTGISEPMLLVTHSDNPITQKQAFKTEYLQNDLFLIHHSDCAHRIFFKHLFGKKDLSVNHKLEFNSSEAIKHCLINGIGVSILPKTSVAREIADGKLSVINWDSEPFETALLMIWHKNKWLSPGLSNLMDISREILKT